MGMFDRVMVQCPKCDGQAEFQSKAGDCVLATYTLETAPAAVLCDIHDDWSCCEKCDHSFQVHVPCTVPVRMRLAALSALNVGYLLTALRDAGSTPCREHNCGTVCLCMSCAAKVVLAEIDPEWRP
jgi:hypothetical protein